MTREEALLTRMGVNVSSKGFGYILESARLLNETPESLDAITKLVYPKIAERHGTTSLAVERCIRHSIKRIYTGDREVPEAFKPPIGTGGMTNKEFLARFAKEVRDEDEGET